MRPRQALETALPVGGVIALLGGVALPWFRIDPVFDPIATTFPRGYSTLAEPGIHRIDLALLGVVGAVLVVQFVGVPRRVRAIVAGVGGAGVALYDLHYLLLSPRIGFSGPVVPVGGWYLTLLGGLLLGASGLYRAAGGRTT